LHIFQDFSCNWFLVSCHCVLKRWPVWFQSCLFVKICFVA
jgi:hypothetical protein